ncbi:MAG: PD-(D/E)XK nuclease family protein [Muribaculaceae bacterium]|nr:PD-(D/E)XK nuclease family protein [Muribaculaceae bacterium]
MTFEEVENRIKEFEASEEYHLLMKPNFLDIVGKPRSETAFSALFAWVLSNKRFYDIEGSPLKLLLLLLKNNASSQEKRTDVKLMDDILKEAISNNIKVRIIDLKREVPTRNTNNRYNGRVDLVIIFEVDVNSNKYSYGIIWENKIDNNEQIDQCKKYYKYFSSSSSLILNGTKYKLKDKIYVFSSIDNPEQEKLSSDKFIRITHQDIYEWILKPLNAAIMNNKDIQDDKRFLEEYISALTSIKTNKKRQIAMDEKTEELLKKLYDKHRDIIQALSLFGSNDEDIAKAVDNKIKSDSTKYQIQYDKDNKKAVIETNQTHLLSDLIKAYMLNENATKEDIDKLFEGEEWQIFSDKKKITGYDTKKIGGKTYRISNQRTRNPEYLGKIISTFGEKGYKVMAIDK